jgi:hypothetical protein
MEEQKIASANYELQDFFTYTPENKFDVIFDYT